MRPCVCGNGYAGESRLTCKLYCRLGLETRQMFMEELVKNLFDKITCRECGADVSNKTRHAMWHLRLDKKMKNHFAEAWTIHFKTLTEL